MINTRNVIQAGEEAKYRIIIDDQKFTKGLDSFTVTLRWGLRGGEKVIPREAMFEDEARHLFFAFDTTEMVGMVEAECTYTVHDSDAQDGVRSVVERAPLCFVNQCAKMPEAPDRSGIYDGRHVRYVRLYGDGLRTLYYYIADTARRRLRDALGRYLRLPKDNA